MMLTRASGERSGPLYVYPGYGGSERDKNHSGCSTTQRESTPMWLGTISAASFSPRLPAASLRLSPAAPSGPAEVAAAVEPLLQRPILLGQQIDPHEEAVEQITEEIGPVLTDIRQLASQGVREGDGGAPQHSEEWLALRAKGRLLFE